MTVYKSVNDELDQAIIVRCGCGSSEHQMGISYTIDPDDFFWSELWIEYHLTTYQNIFQRIWTAIKYVLGYHCKYGHWDCITLTRKDAVWIREFLDGFIVRTTND